MAVYRGYDTQNSAIFLQNSVKILPSLHNVAWIVQLAAHILAFILFFLYNILTSWIFSTVWAKGESLNATESLAVCLEAVDGAYGWMKGFTDGVALSVCDTK